MNDAEYEDTCGRIRRITDLWATDLVPGNVDCQRYFYRSTADFIKHGETVGPDCDAFARCRWHYLQVELHFNVESLWQDDRTDAYLEKVIVHEMTHFLIDELIPRDGEDKGFEMHMERVTSGITYSLLAVRDRAKTYAPVEGEY